MFVPSPSEWRVLSALLDEVLDLTGDAHAEWLARLQREQPALAARVAEFLAERDELTNNRFLEGSATPPPVIGGRAGAQCGPYVLESLIGRGGMGSVWCARRADGRYDGTVAIKLLSSSLMKADGERRFRREGQILARLRHPRIAQLLDAGVTDDGQPYLVLEHVAGTHIDEYCSANALDLRARVGLVLEVMSAVSHAHAKLVVHRDLKPSNILVDETGQVKLLDFGIAKLLEPDAQTPALSALTREGGQLLTLLYASPEQVSGEEISTATDVYAMGVVLFELLTGSMPYKLGRESRGALEEAILTGDPLRPSERVDDLPRQRSLRGDLDTIVLKALHKVPSERYPTIAAFADDLEAWRDARPVRARPTSFGYRASRFIRRNRLGVAAAAAVTLSILGGAGAALSQAKLARAEQQRAEEITRFITGIFRDADPYLGDGTTLSATDLLRQARDRLDQSLRDRPELRLELLWLIGSSLASLQAFNDAEPLLREAADQSAQLFGPSDQKTVRAQIGMSNLHRFKGRLDAMDTVVTQALATLRGLSNVDPALLVTALLDSVHLTIDRGNPKQALGPAREAMAVATSRLPLRHEMRVNAALMMAVSLEHDGRDHKATLDAALSALDATRAYFGGVESHPRVVDAHLVLGRALGRVGRTREAIAVLQRADSASGVGMGENNLTRAFIRASTAAYRVAIGQEAQGLADYDEAHRLFVANADTASVSYAIVQGHRGDLLLRLQRANEAEPPLRNALMVMERVRGAGHPRLLPYRVRLYQSQAERGRVDEAARSLSLLAPAMQDTVAVPAATRMLWHRAQGVVAARRGRARDAVQFYEQALAERADTASAVTLAPLQVDLGVALLAMGDRERAAAVLRTARDAFRAAGHDPTVSEREAERALAVLQRPSS